MIVLPMLGRSSRFFSAGYTKPKFMLPLWGKTVFEHVVSSFENYFHTDRFVFVVRYDFKDISLLENTIKALGIKDFAIKVHRGETLGQADSVKIALHEEDPSDELYIFNIDTILYDFHKADMSGTTGYLEVFNGEGDHWSFALPKETGSNAVAQVTEKRRISNLCSNGLYGFSSVTEFLSLLEVYKLTEWDGASELYVAPLFETAIKSGKHVFYEQVDTEQIGFCGVPSEYEMLSVSQPAEKTVV